MSLSPTPSSKRMRDGLPVLVTMVLAIALAAYVVLRSVANAQTPGAPATAARAPDATPPSNAPAPDSGSPSARPRAFDPALVQRGAQLATLGDCIVCHTAPGGRSFAGGRAVVTPFGTIYGPNITPDPDTGIGRWSEAAFVRAMREGIDDEGDRLYPAFPYDHFTLIADDDLKAIYAYLMTRDPVSAQPPENQLHFPFNIRPLLAIWQALFLERRAFHADPQQSAQWNRGAYLVAGLSHCGACHTPRNFLGAEKRDHALSGGEAEGWHAPAINGASPSLVRWDADAIYAYLRNGIAPRHGASGGPMNAVTHNLAGAPETDVRAIAVYVASLQPATHDAPASVPEAQDGASSNVPQPTGGGEAQAGRAVYETACASCHEQPRNAFFGGALPLRASTALRVGTPDNLVQIVLRGITPAGGERGPWMPAFSGSLDEGQLSALVHYLRTSVAAQPDWRDVDRSVRDARRAAPESS